MSKNDTAREVIKKYLETPNPGYALLVDAPWGAGKTHLILEILQDLANRAAPSQMMGSQKNPYLYASLFGTNSNRTVDDVIIAETNWNLLEKGIKAVSTVKIGDVGVNLGRPTIANWLIPRLPNIVVLDDLERSTLEVEALYGQINKYVEHGNKNVILIENTAKNLDKGKVAKWREKLIGRTVKIKADVELALPVFIDDLKLDPKGNVLESLSRLSPEIIRVFHRGKFRNLRLLKRAIYDLAWLLGEFEDDFFGYPDKIDELSKSFVALSIAFHSGQVKRGELLKRDVLGSYRPADKTGIGKLQERLWFAQITGTNNPVLPLKVSSKLIGAGHMAAKEINAALKESGHFSPETEKPLWLRALYWAECLPSEAETLENEMWEAVNDQSVTHPGELLHICHALHWMSKEGAIHESHEQINLKFVTLIDRLVAEGLLPPSDRKNHEFDNQYFRVDGNMVSHSGHAFELDDNMREMTDAMQAAQDKAFVAKLPQIITEITAPLRDDPAKFVSQLKGEAGDWIYPKYSIFSKMSANEFADSLFGIFQSNRVMADIVARDMQRRITNGGLDLLDDAEWLECVGNEMVTLAKKRSPISAAQVQRFANRFLTTKMTHK